MTKIEKLTSDLDDILEETKEREVKEIFIVVKYLHKDSQMLRYEFPLGKISATKLEKLTSDLDDILEETKEREVKEVSIVVKYNSMHRDNKMLHHEFL